MTRDNQKYQTRKSIKKAQARKLQQQAARNERIRQSRVQLTGILDAQAVRPPKPNIEQLIEKLPHRPLVETVKQWRNAIEALHDPKKSNIHSEAKQLLTAIGKEWRKRRANPDPNDWFAWPSTEAPAGAGSIDTHDWPEKGILKFMGYAVGRTEGIPKPLRQEILSRVFSSEIPPALPPDKLLEWSEANTACRLRKMAESIASFTRNAKRRDDEKQGDAIRDWEDDLELLYETYYIGYFNFSWPSTIFL